MALDFKPHSASQSRLVGPRVLAAALLLLTLGSCSYSYRVTAAIVRGALIFNSDDDRRTSAPSCWDNFTIVDEDGKPVWEFDVPYGAFSGREDCGPNFPIRYGHPPARAETIIAPRRFVVGRTYVIDGHSAGMLEGAFSIVRVDGALKLRNLNPESAAALSIRDSHYAWEREHDPPRISQTELVNTAFVLQAPPERVARIAAAGQSGRDAHTWVLHPDEWMNHPSLSYGDLSTQSAVINFSCRYTEGPIYARVAPPAAKGIPLKLTSEGHSLSARLIGSGNPRRRDRIDALLPADSPTYDHFARTGNLTVQQGARRAEANAINGEERAVVRRFFELCRTPVTRPLATVDEVTVQVD